MRLSATRLLFVTSFVLAASAEAVVSRSANISHLACQSLNLEYNQFLFLPNETGYSKLRVENWSGTADKTPACIFKPDNVEDVSRVVKQLQQYKVQFAIRSGGHLPSPGAANIDGGVLIDLGGFNEVEYDAERNVARVGSGLTWGEVYQQLDEFNVTVVGGRVLDVGVGGLILGGGLSYLSDIYGLACDNVVNFEVVLSTGEIVSANQTSNTDLFWALKGGGNNFGIVTTFTLSTYPNSQVWGGVKAYTLSELPSLYDAMYTYQTTPDKDPRANLMLQGYVSNETIGIVLNLIYLSPQPSPPAFQPFYHINTTSDTTKISSLTDFLDGQGPISFPPRIDWRSTSFTPDKTFYDKLNSLMTNSSALQKIKSVQSGTVAFGMQPISTSAIEAGIARGGNALGLQVTNQTWYVIDSGWFQAADDLTVHNATKDMVDAIRAEDEAEGVHLPYMFMNDASYDQDVIAGYGETNVARLNAIAAKYDPDGVFQTLVPGGFKLPKMSG